MFLFKSAAGETVVIPGRIEFSCWVREMPIRMTVIKLLALPVHHH